MQKHFESMRDIQRFEKTSQVRDDTWVNSGVSKPHGHKTDEKYNSSFNDKVMSHDFAVGGTTGALSALIKSIISKTHLLHYGSGFLPFLEQLPGVDQDATCALKADISNTDSDDYTLGEEDDDEIRVGETETAESANGRMQTDSTSLEINFLSRERRSSIPLAKTVPLPYQADRTVSPKQHIQGRCFEYRLDGDCRRHLPSLITKI